jgi:hypothetical protein
MADKEVESEFAVLDILSGFDLSGSVKRKSDIEDIIEFCRTQRNQDVFKDGYSIMFLTNGIGTYLLGLDEATIYYSSLAVEIILLAKLTNTYGEYRHEEMNTFCSIIKNCEKVGILDQERKKLADKLREVRDCYIHYDNILNYASDMSKKLFESVASKAEHVKNSKADLMDFSPFEKAYPFSKARPLSAKRTNFLSERGDEYVKWLKSQGLDIIDVVKIGYTAEENMKYRRVRQQRFDALTALKWSFQILHFVSH